MSDSSTNNNLKQSLRKNINDYDIYIFDLDGTLYFQKPFRIAMARYLAFYVLRHPFAVKDIFLLKLYREIREDWDKYSNDSIGKSLPEDLSMEDKQYSYVARKKNVSFESVKKAVSFFMLEAPLSILPKYVDSDLKHFIEELKKKGKTVVIYSDYPVIDKLKALSIEGDYCYTSEDENIGTMKPDKKGIRVILSDLNVSSDVAVMIGDRYEKDGLSAIANNVDYMILSSKKSERVY